jgi:hypothetical protein
MNKVCDAGGICGHTPQCDHFCHFTNADLEVRKIKPYPAVPVDMKPVPEGWQMIGSVLFGLAMAMLLVISFALFFTGLWVWTLLI